MNDCRERANIYVRRFMVTFIKTFLGLIDDKKKTHSKYTTVHKHILLKIGVFTRVSKGKKNT